MADPHLTPTLDGLDRLTVRAYRVGLLIMAVGLGLMAASFVGHDVGLHMDGRFTLAVGATLSAWNLHLYDRRFRWVFHGLAWTALLAMGWAATRPGGPAAWFARELGIGLHLAFLSAVALKEQFCFRVPVLRLMPVVLVPTALGHAFDLGPLAPVGLAFACAIGLLMATVKFTQPLGHDIGDRRAYQH